MNNGKMPVILPFVAIVVSLVLGAYVLHDFMTRCEDEMYVSIGSYDIFDSGARASIREVAKLLKRCSEGKKFTVAWHAGQYLFTTIYDRENHIIGYETDPGSGYTKSWGRVKDSTVEAVAAAGGNFKSFQSDGHAPD